MTRQFGVCPSEPERLEERRLSLDACATQDRVCVPSVAEAFMRPEPGSIPVSAPGARAHFPLEAMTVPIDFCIHPPPTSKANATALLRPWA